MQEVEQAAVARGPDLALLVPVPVRAAVPRVEARQPHDRAARGQRGPLRAQELARARVSSVAPASSTTPPASSAKTPPDDAIRNAPEPSQHVRAASVTSAAYSSSPYALGGAQKRTFAHFAGVPRARARRRRRAQALELGVRRRRRRLADDPRAGVRLAPQAARRSPQHAAADDVQRRRRRRGQGVGTGHDEEDVVHRCTDLHNALACTKNFWKLTS